jgi:D-amino-acid dehydrogenase
VVVGAGIVGSYVAYELAKAGFGVDVVDSSLATCTASSGNAGILAVSYAKPLSNPTTARAGFGLLRSHDSGVDVARPLTTQTLRWLARFAIQSRPGRASKAAHQIYMMATRSIEMYDELAAEEDVDLRLRRTGWLHVVRSHTELARQTRAAAELRTVGVQSQFLDQTDLRAIEPHLGPGHVGGVLFRQDVSMDPAHVTHVVRSIARGRGVRFHEGRVVAARTGPRATVVRTSGGAEFEGDAVVVAAGAESTALIRTLFKQSVHVLPGYGWHLDLPVDRPLASRALMGIEDHVVVNPGPRMLRVTGGMQLGGRPGIVPTTQQVAQLRMAAERVLPGIAELGPGTTWRGARPMTPSGLPLVKRCGTRAYAATGHGTLGMTLAPYTAGRCRDLLLQATV